MPYTEQDEEDLKKIASGKSGIFSKEYKRQYRDGRKDALAEGETPVIMQPGGSKEDWEMVGGRQKGRLGQDKGEIGKKWDETFK